MRWVLAVVVGAAVATGFGVATLWPTQEGCRGRDS